MKSIHISSTGDLLLIEAPEKPDFKALKKDKNYQDYKFFSGNTDKDILEQYKQAVQQAIDNGVMFSDQKAIGNLLWDMLCTEEGIYQIPSGYTVEVKQFCGCYDLKGPSKECLEAGGKNPYKCVRDNIKLAFLIPSQEPKEELPQPAEDILNNLRSADWDSKDIVPTSNSLILKAMKEYASQERNRAVQECIDTIKKEGNEWSKYFLIPELEKLKTK